MASCLTNFIFTLDFYHSCSDDAFEVEFVAQDGYTYTLVPLYQDDLISLRQKRAHSDLTSEPVPL